MWGVLPLRSQRLAARVRAGAEAVGARVVDFGVLTTPQLHFIVREYNLGRNTWASEAGYATVARWLHRHAPHDARCALSGTTPACRRRSATLPR